MFKSAVSTISIIFMLGLSAQASSQSFADAVKDGFLPLTNLMTADSSSAKKSNDSNKNTQALTLKDGTVYVGEMKGKRPHGKGKAIYKNGDVYEGGFVKGRREGNGEYRFKNGERYEGSFKENCLHGQGVLYYSDGKKYNGAWENDHRHGYGRMFNVHVHTSNKFRLILAVYIFTDLLATENVLVALVVDVVVHVSALHVVVFNPFKFLAFSNA